MTATLHLCLRSSARYTVACHRRGALRPVPVPRPHHNLPGLAIIPGQSKEMLRHSVESIGVLPKHLQIRIQKAVRAPLVDSVFHAFDTVRNDCERVVELMCQSRRHGAHCCDPLGPPHLVLEFSLEPRVTYDEGIAYEPPCGVGDLALREAHGEWFTFLWSAFCLDVDH